MSCRTVLAFCVLSLAASAAQAADDCPTVTDDGERLACFDAAYPARAVSRVLNGSAAPATSTARPAQTAAPAGDGPQALAGAWMFDTAPTQSGTGEDLFLWVDAAESITCGGQDVRPTLFLRCMDKQTAILLVTDCKVSSAGVGGLVSYRVDQGPTRLRTFVERSDQTALGLWDAAAAAPFLRDIRGGSGMTLKFTPAGEGRQRDLTFDISGVDEAVARLDGACGG